MKGHHKRCSVTINAKNLDPDLNIYILAIINLSELSHFRTIRKTDIANSSNVILGSKRKQFPFENIYTLFIRKKSGHSIFVCKPDFSIKIGYPNSLKDDSGTIFNSILQILKIDLNLKFCFNTGC